MSDYIPFEIQVSIMNRLPVKALLQFRTVSKSWKNSIDSQNFVIGYGVRPSETYRFTLTYDQGHFGYLYLVDDDLSFHPLNLIVPSFPRSFDFMNFPYIDLTPVGTSEGVWCFHSYYKSIVIWNPSLRKSVGLMVPNWLRNKSGRKSFIAFGVSPENLDPTVLHISLPKTGHGEWFVTVFSFATKHWRPIETQNTPRDSIRLKRSSQAVIGRYIFWVASENIVQHESDRPSYKRYMLMSFDMITQTFLEVQIPECIRVHLPIPFTILGHRGAVVIHGNILSDVNNVFCVRMLELEGASLTGRILLNFTNVTHCCLKLLGFTMFDEPIIEVETPFQAEHTLEVYQHWSQQFHNVCVEGDAGTFYMGPYKESLILLTEQDGSIY